MKDKLNKKEMKEELSKALHRALATAYKKGNQVVKKAIDSSDSNTLKGIVADLQDPNSTPEIGSSNLPVEKDAVLTKDIDAKKEPNAIAQAYDISQDQKKAGLGMQTNPHPQPKEPRKLKNFMSERSAKLGKAEHPAISKYNAVKQAESEAKLKSPAGEAERKAKNAAMTREQRIKEKEATSKDLAHVEGKYHVESGFRDKNGNKTTEAHTKSPDAVYAKRSAMEKSDKIASAQHGLKTAQMKLKHEHEKAKLASEKPSKPFGTTEKMHPTGKNTMMGQVARKQSLNEFKGKPSPKLGKSYPTKLKGVHPSLVGGGMSRTGLNAILSSKTPRGHAQQKHRDEAKNAAMDQHKKFLKEIKSMPKPNLGKARVDEGMSVADKQYARHKRAGNHIKGVHTAPFKSAAGMSNAGYGVDIGDKGLAHENHKAILEQVKKMPKLNLNKSKNVREQRKKVFGTKGDPSKKEYKEKQIAALSGLAEKRYGMPVVPSKGKIDEATGQRKTGSKAKSPKPDWRSGDLESEQTAQAVSHEMGHLDTLPEKIAFKDAQNWMDEGSKEAGEKYKGAAKQTEREIVPMAAENPIRRRAGVPAFARPQDKSPIYGESSKMPLKWEHPPRKSMDSDREYAIRVKNKKGNPVDLIGVSQNLRPEDKERMQQIDEGSLKFNPEKGWEPSDSAHALINLRGRGKYAEAAQRLKDKHQKKGQMGLPLAMSEKGMSQKQWFNMSRNDKRKHLAIKDYNEKNAGKPIPSTSDILKQVIAERDAEKAKREAQKQQNPAPHKMDKDEENDMETMGMGDMAMSEKPRGYIRKIASKMKKRSA